MIMWQDAIPVGYRNDAASVVRGRAYLGTRRGPMLQVRERLVDDEGEDDSCVVLEFENCIGVANEEIMDQLGLIGRNIGTTLRLGLHHHDAIQLCHNLITALASTGDRVAGLMHEKMVEAMIEIRRARDEAGPDDPE
jgi:hypothetical protein